MNNILEDLKKYFAETPQEKVMRDWSESNHFDEVGPNIDKFFEVSKILIKYQGNFWKEKENFNILANPKYNLRVSFFNLSL